MKKILTLFALLLLCAVTATAQNGVKLTFDRSGTTPNDVTVNVTDLSGAALTGVTATLESTSITGFKTGSAAALSRTTNSVLAPQTGYNNTQNESIWYVFKIEGLTSAFEYVYSAVDVYALTGQGGAQGNGGNTKREWDIEVATGNSAANLATFTSLTNKDICTVTESDGNLYHKSWEAEGTATAATDPIYLKVTLTKRASLGCFAGIGSVSLKAEDLTQYRDALQDAITAANSLPTGEGPNKYTVTGGSDELNAAVAAGEAELNKDESEQTKASLVAARTAIETALSNLTKTLNMPQAGFYRIKGNTSGKYVSNGGGNGVKYTMAETADETTIFYYDGEKIINFKTGLCVNLPGWTWAYGNESIAVTFIDGLSNGGYAIQNGVDNNKGPIHLYDDNNGPCDRGAFAENTLATQNARYRNWYLEAVTELPITLRSTDDTNYFATFSAPVNVQISGASLNTVTNNNKTAAYNTVDTYMLKAGVGVLLSGTSATATATIITDEVTDANYGLVSYYAATAGTGDESKLYLGKGKDSGVAGFYKLGSGTTSNGFKAYLSTAAGAKEGLELEFAGVTGIDNMENGTLNMENGAVYNLQGQRVNKAQKGVYIQNGRKVVLK